MSAIKQYTDLYDAMRDAVHASTGEPLNALRTAARAGLDLELLPTRRTEGDRKSVV